MDLRDFESILIFFSEEEIEELQAAIDKRRSLALDEESLPKLAEPSDYSANGVEGLCHSDSSATHTLYRVPDNMYVVHVDKGEESWLESHGGQGLNEGMVRTFFPELAAAAGSD